MSRILFISILITLHFLIGQAQGPPAYDQFLRLENTRSAKTLRFYKGDKLRFKTENSTWRSGRIESLDLVQQMIFLDTGPVRIKDIRAIQSSSQYFWSQYIKYKLMVFGGGVLFFSIFNPLAGLPYPIWALPVGGGSLLLGYLAGNLLKQNYYRQLLDLSFD